MPKSKYGLNTKGWSLPFRTVLGSIEGYLGAAGFSGQAVANSPSQLFSVIVHVYGVKTNPMTSFEMRVAEAQRCIEQMPRKQRSECQAKSRAEIAAVGLSGFAKAATGHSPVPVVIFPDPPKPKVKAKPAAVAEKPNAARVVSWRDKFYKSWEWRTLRMEVLKHSGPVCSCCGAERGDINAAGEKVKICVDHIKPISKFWHLRLDRSNLQVLCDECNQGKGAWDETDWREEPAPERSQLEQMIIDQLTPRQ
jgi:5-methylcytosine-specific restriction endonuclease McrA